MEAVKATQRIPQELRRVTYFSIYDQWDMHMVYDNRTCERCLPHLGSYSGNDLRITFPFLEIIDENLIYAHVHPNCRCYLMRIANPMDPRMYEPEERVRVRRYG